ncbi:MAG TPA: SDR family NAD(P)-dependent oxidoreductase [Ilumatobacter sp.]|nr:SDR family NAD(P)-dependent oxidoreductase [Ilumatobacter sp.]
MSTTAHTSTDSTAAPAPISDFSGQIAVVTGGGSGMGRELAIQLATAGAHVAICDVDTENMDVTLELAAAAAAPGVELTAAIANVAERSELDAFATHVATEFETGSINLLFNNAGVSGGPSIVNGDEASWDRTFAITWGGVLNGTRAFLPLLLAARRAQVVNTSSVNGMWACLGPHGPHTCYSAAKFAVKGFTEALIVDFRMNAPHVTAAVVMPGHIGTAIMKNSFVAMGLDPKHVSDEFIAQTRDTYAKRGVDISAASDEDIRNVVALQVDAFEHAAPTSAAEAATIILDGIKAGEWRILVGTDAQVLDAALRADPTAAYDVDFTDRLTAAGHFGGLIREG